MMVVAASCEWTLPGPTRPPARLDRQPILFLCDRKARQRPVSVTGCGHPAPCAPGAALAPGFDVSAGVKLQRGF